MVKNYPNCKKPVIDKPKTNLCACPSCKEISWIEFDKVWYSHDVNLMFINKNIKSIRKHLHEIAIFLRDCHMQAKD